MSLIPCTQNCRYQRDGLCTLDQASAPVSQTVPNDACLNYTPRLSPRELSELDRQRGDGLPDIVHLNEL